MTRDMEAQDLQRRLAELPREIAPTRDPWPDIAARIDASRLPSRHRAWRWPAVAAAATLVLATWIVLGPATRQDVAESPGLSAAAPIRSLPVVVEASEMEYQAAFREFIPVGNFRLALPVQTLQRIESGWADMKDTESALASALAQRPDDPFLNSRMLELRARQLGFLRQLAMLDQDYRRQTI